MSGKTLAVKKIKSSSIIYNYRTLGHVKTKNDVISEILVHCIFILWVNTKKTQNLTGLIRWVLVVKLTPFDEILR